MPLRLQKRSIELADKGTYPGQTGQTWRIKNHVFFYNTDRKIKIFVESCKLCCDFTDKKSKRTHGTTCCTKQVLEKSYC